MKVESCYLDIYEYELNLLILNKNESKINNLVENYNQFALKNGFSKCDTGAFDGLFSIGTNGKKRMCFTFPNNQLNLDTVVHEITHAVNFIRETIGYNASFVEDEPTAYLAAALYNKIIMMAKKLKVKINI